MHNEINFSGSPIIGSTVVNQINTSSEIKNSITELMHQLEQAINAVDRNRTDILEQYVQLKDAIERGDSSKAKARCELLLKLLSGTASITTILRGIEALLR